MDRWMDAGISCSLTKNKAPRTAPTGDDDMTFIEILNNEETRRMVEAIEDTQISLRGKEGDTILENILQMQIKELRKVTGWNWAE